jgi:hypothetical protein
VPFAFQSYWVSSRYPLAKGIAAAKRATCNADGPYAESGADEVRPVVGPGQSFGHWTIPERFRPPRMHVKMANKRGIL